MKTSITQERYLFTESLAFIAPKDSKPKYILEEFLKVLPLVSIIMEAKDFKETIHNRKVYEDDLHGNYIFDVRFSSLSITKHAVNLIGLGVLILPFRLVATYLRENDLSHSRKCDNPHFLDDLKIQTCTMINQNAQTHYEGMLKHVPGEEDFCKRRVFRDHIQHPEYLYKSCYKDPFEKPGDQPIKDKEAKSLAKNKHNMNMKAKQVVWGTHVN